MNRRNGDTGDTPLNEAAIKGHKDVVALLLENGADLNTVDDAGATPLENATHFHHTEVIELLMAKGAKIADQNRPGINLLNDAVMKGQADLVELLVSKGVDVNAADVGGRTALDGARALKYESVAAFLESVGAKASPPRAAPQGRRR